MKRSCAVLLICLLLFTSCRAGDAGTSVRAEEFVTDSEWFDTEVYFTRQYEDAGSQEAPAGCGDIIYADGDKVLVYECYDIGAPDYLNIEGDMPDVCHLNEYDLTSPQDDLSPQATIDLKAYGLVYQNEDLTDYSSIKMIWYRDGICYFIVGKYSEGVYQDGEGVYQAKITAIDIADGKIVKECEGDDINSVFANESVIIEGLRQDGSGVTVLVTDYSSSGGIKTVRLSEALDIEKIEPVAGLEGYNAGMVYNMEDGFLLSCYNGDSPETWFKVGADNVAVPSEGIDESGPGRISVLDGEVYRSDISSIRKLDRASGEYQDFLDYNNSNIDRQYVDRLRLIYASDDTMIATATTGSTGRYAFFRFTRAEHNPNVGRSIIRICSPDDYIRPEVTEAICDFNNTSSDVYIVYDDRYLVDNFMETDASDLSLEEYYSDDYAVAKAKARSEAMNRIRLDIISGTGPDILLDCYDMAGLNSDLILTDLRPFITGAEGFTEGDYFPVLLDGEDEIYQFPLEVSLNALYYDGDYSSYFDGYGISFESYNEMLSDANNGKDPISALNTRTNYLITLFDYYYQDYVKDGKVDLDNDEFRALAEFVKDKPELFSFDMDPVMCSYNWTGTPDYLTAGFNVAGLPSAGSGGLMLNCDASIAISAACPRIEELKPFVVSLLTSSGMNREVYRQKSTDIISLYNEQIAKQDEIWGESSPKIPLENVDIQMEAIDNARGIISFDPDINVILMEEIQPYFEGDKTLDEVIPVIEDRCATVISERSL